MGYNTANISRAFGFEHAREKHNKTKPIARNKDGVRPLGDRRHHHMASISMPDPDTVHLNLCGKPFVVWHADDTFEVHHPQYISAGLVDNMHPYLPKGHFVWNRGRLFIEMNPGERYEFKKGDVLRMQKVNDRYFFYNKPVAYARRMKRGVVDGYMKAYVPFLDWLTVVAVDGLTYAWEDIRNSETTLREAVNLPDRKWFEKVVNGTGMGDKRSLAYSLEADVAHIPFTRETTPRKFHTPSCEVLHKWVSGDDPAMWAQVLPLMTSVCGAYSYRVSAMGGSSGYRMRVTHAVDFLRNLVSHLFREEVFELVRLEDGKISSGRNDNFYSVNDISREKINRQLVEVSV